MSKRMLSLAWTTIKGRKGGFVAAFLAVLFGSALVAATGILLETGISSGVQTERYEAAAVVVGADQTFPVAEDINPRFAERVTLPADRVDQVGRVAGARTAVGDVSVPVALVTPDRRVVEGPDGFPLAGHAWSAAVLGPFTLSQGRQPGAPDEVVLDAQLAARTGVSAGNSVELVLGSTPSVYRVAGLVTPPGGDLARQSALFFTDERARELYGRPDRVDTVGVLAEPGIEPEDLATRINEAIPEVVVYTGSDRGDAEFLDIGQTRAFVIELATAFGASIVLVVMIVVASTLALSVQQRRRELALLRAIGATPKQVLGMIGAETTVVGVSGAVLGVILGIGLGVLLHDTFVAVGAMPADFELVISPLPVLAALVLCVLSARLGGWIAARRAAKVSPVEALGEAAVEPPKLGWIRLTMGVLLIPAGLAAAVVLPLVLPGESAIDGAASSALLLVISVFLLGPRLLKGAVAVFGPLLNRASVASGFLANANAHANSRRLSSATTPLIMGVTMAAVQFFSTTTMSAAAQEQASDGIVADYVVTSTFSGLSPELADVLRGLAGVSVVTPVVRSQALVTYVSGDSPQTKTFPTQGVTADYLGETMDLDVLSGDVANLRGDTVALSRIAAGTVGAAVGDTIDLHLGDGTAIRPRVVALYERGLGFGDVTLPHDVLIGHTTNRLDSDVLVSAAPGAEVATVGETLRSATASYPTAAIADRGTFVAAQSGAKAWESAVGFMLNAILLGYIAIAVVNTLVMATAARVREFAMLQLIGASRQQVRAMMRRETSLIVFSAVLIGTLAAIPSLIGISLGVTRSPIPSIPPLAYAGIVAVAALLGWAAIMISTRIAMRPKPVQAIGTQE